MGTKEALYEDDAGAMCTELEAGSGSCCHSGGKGSEVNGREDRSEPTFSGISED
jgi:hypothetical protein